MGRGLWWSAAVVMAVIGVAWVGAVVPLAAEEAVEEEPAAKPEDPLPGHSHVGEAFSEGPRQSAVLIPGCGDVHFPITVSWDQGQAFFDQGIGQLHGFWYYEAERSFREIAAHDPGCAMAYWGMSMANFENPARARKFIDRAVELKEGVSPRERKWIEAQAGLLGDEPKDDKERRKRFIKALEELVYDDPSDVEAKAFLACRLWQFDRQGLPINSHVAVNALLDQVFAANPMHPAHHYRIHLWDYEKAERALESSAVLHSTSPAIAHMWHMPGHIYSRLNRYPEAVWHQEASVRVDHSRMHEARVLPDQIFNYSHNSEWLVRNFINIGARDEALTLAKAMIDNPRHPKLNHPGRGGSSAANGRSRLLDTLEAFELWSETLRLADTHYLEPTDLPAEQITRLHKLAAAAFELEDRERFEAFAGEVAAMQSKVEQERDAAAQAAKESAAAEGKNAEEAEKAGQDAAKPFEDRINRLTKAGKDVAIYRRMLAGEGVSREEIDGLDRGKGARAMLQLRLGDLERARQLANETAGGATGETLPLAIKAHVEARCGDIDAALATFGQLRAIAVRADIEAPPFRRLAWLAGRAGAPEDWRPTPEQGFGPDFGDKLSTDIKALGPLAFEPPPAPPLQAAGEDGSRLDLSQFSGKPVAVLFYLGHGCEHCVEQLNAFAEAADRIRESGIEVVAVSNEQAGDLSGAHALCTSGDRFPFPLCADPDQDAFKAFRAFDDFENMALHGTFLISPDGRVLWQDIGAEPFMDVEFFLRESQRLLEVHG